MCQIEVHWLTTGDSCWDVVEAKPTTTELLNVHCRLDHLKTKSVPCPVQVSLDQYHTEEEIYQMSLQREPRKPAVSRTLTYIWGPVVAWSQISHIRQ